MNSKNLIFLLAGGVLLAGVANTSAQTLTPGDLVVSTYGTPTSTGLIDGQAVPISLQVFTPSTTATGESPLSTTVLNGIVGEYGSSSEGNIQLTGNGQDLTITGYNATEAAAGIGAYTAGTAGNGTGNYPGNNGDSTPNANPWSDNLGQPYGGTAASGATAAKATEVPLAQSSTIDVAREADVIGNNANVVSTTSFSNVYNTNNPRSAYSATGSSIYISGQGDSKSHGDEGIFYSPTTGASYSGSTSPTAIYTSNDTRYITGYNGNIYYSLDKSGSPTGIFEFSGSPTSGATATQITPASFGGVNLSPEGFWFANATTLYVADTGVPKAGGVGDGGIQKWVSNDLGQWTLAYTLTPSTFVPGTATSGETGFEAITGSVVGGVVNLYAVSYTAADDNPNGLYAIADTLTATTGSGETFTELASAGGAGEENFKGVSFAPAAAPEPSTTSLVIVAVLGAFAFAWKRKKSLKA